MKKDQTTYLKELSDWKKQMDQEHALLSNHQSSDPRLV